MDLFLLLTDYFQSDIISIYIDMNKNLILFCKVIGEPKRMLILGRLKKECCVSQLWKKLDLSQNLTSHHLRVLKKAGLISSEKRGKQVVYCLNEKSINRQIEQLEKFLKK